MLFDKLLRENFLPSSLADWRHLAQAEGGHSNTWHTADGLSLSAYYTQPPAQQNFLQTFHHRTAHTWRNMAHVTVHDEQHANDAALRHLHHEADGILFTLTKPDVNFSTLLKNISWPHCALSFVVTHAAQASQLHNYINSSYPGLKLSGCVFHKSESSALLPIHGVVHYTSLGITVPSSTPAVEIADALIKATRIINHHVQAGVLVDNIIEHIGFCINIEQDFLQSIAKLKTLRMLWYQVTQAYGVNYLPENLPMHTLSPAWHNEAYEPQGNLIKGTLAAAAAMLGGCNAHTTMPDDESDMMQPRIARNTAMILHDEAHLLQVSDALAGAFVIEHMVDALAQKSWQLFTQQSQ